MSNLYLESQFQKITCAYSHIFSNLTPGFEGYLDFGRSRPWSFLTTDFRRVSYARSLELHKRSEAIHSSRDSAEAKASALSNASRELETGFSVGICPWTDSLLLETFDSKKDELTIVVGHDWYPVGAGVLAESGLHVQGLHYTPKYQHWCPAGFFDPKHPSVTLFLNLYPDYRGPLAAKTGKIPKGGGLTYAQCVAGFQELLRSLNKQYKRVQIVSWGAYVWNEFAPYVADLGSMKNLKAQMAASMGRPLKLFERDYLPMAHPSFASNHNRAHLSEGFRALGLGTPGFAGRRR
ncbi:hypothetical protein ACG02S_02190 [Roseateles sp. DC23W]|uniref:Uracil DNA glycosylase superfamily protein n=1 Tax=Pelomonas dachongensis TaxID=3299029 RepID=A0ABW7EK78_9BURK